VIPGWVFRYLCLLTAVANMAGNVGLLLFYKPLFELIGVPLPDDLHAFALESVLSFTMGVVALLVFLNPARNRDLLKIGIIGKGAYGLITYYFYVVHQVHWFYLVFVAWDALFVVIFFLYWIKLASPDLLERREDILAGLAPPAGQEPARRALVVTYSLTGNGKKAVARLQAGLEREGYEVDLTHPVPAEQIYRFPMSFLDFLANILRAFVRKGAAVSPLRTPDDRDDYDLVVVESQTWLLGASAPLEATLYDPRNLRLFSGRDAAVLVVCRGAHRRTEAMLVRGLERCGANVIASRGFAHKGREPLRLMSLWAHLISKGKDNWLGRWASRRYGLSDADLDVIERYGQALGRRARTKMDWVHARQRILDDLEAEREAEATAAGGT
jgi:hypothetical protein